MEFAIQRANALDSPLLVAFAITDEYPDAILRHFWFMLEGLQQVEAALRRRKIRVAIQRGHPPNVIGDLAKRASEVICDRGYLRHQVQWHKVLARECPCPVWQVEADVIVPVQAVSVKRE